MIITNIQNFVCGFKRKHSESWAAALDEGSQMASVGSRRLHQVIFPVQFYPGKNSNAIMNLSTCVPESNKGRSW